MNDHFYAVIMAGGGGTRLWPLSRRARPKQMLNLFDDRTLFQIAVRRLDSMFPPERILVVTVEEQAKLLKVQCPEIPAENFIIEPMPRGTASAIGLAAVALAHRDRAAIMAVLTADHFIRDESRFRSILTAAGEVAAQDYLVTLGITPTFASSGYGYIEYQDPIGEFQGFSAYQVSRFVEKPDAATAQSYLELGNYAWNSGMFIWKLERIFEELRAQLPALAAGLDRISESWGSSDQDRVVSSVWKALESQTIDYGIMEGASKVAVLPAKGIGWSDVGSWDSLFDVIPTDENGNIFIRSDHLELESNDSLLYDDSQHRLVVLLGVQDLIVVETDDVLLVCHKDQSQEVRQVVDQLKSRDRSDLL